MNSKFTKQFLLPNGLSAMASLMTIAACLALAGCERSGGKSPAAERKQPANADPLMLALAPHQGEGRTDIEIRRLQQQVRSGQNRDAALERLGWVFVSKARESFDAGFYKLAEQCALAQASNDPHRPEALLLRGHVLQNLHRFKEAESLAHELVARRGLALDYGLLGDTLMEQGKLSDAVAAYQQMADQKPDSQVCARAAHVRWLKGDLEGAIEMMQMAAKAVSPRDAEASAWAFTRLANYQFQSGSRTDAARNCASALQTFSNYPPALLLQGRMMLAQNKSAEAVEVLRMAVQCNPLPEYQWTLAEALRVAGHDGEATRAESKLKQHGTTTDPRTFALFLATRGEASESAVRLATCEMNSRQDVFTHDALAWALAAAGNLPDAQRHIEKALAEGTQDARLFLHAAIIAARTDRADDAKKFSGKCSALADLLLPSECSLLRTIVIEPSTGQAAISSGTPENFSTRGN